MVEEKLAKHKVDVDFVEDDSGRLVANVTCGPYHATLSVNPTYNDVCTSAGYYGYLMAKDFFNRYGFSPTFIAKWVRNAFYYKCIVPIKEFDCLITRVDGKSVLRKDVGLYKKVMDNLPMLRQTCKDGGKNILPFVFFLEKTPKDLKKWAGKGLWKEVCKNSFTRNFHLATTLYYDSAHGDDPNTLRSMNKIPSTLLKEISRMVPANPLLWLTAAMILHDKGNVTLKTICTGRNFNITKVINEIMDVKRSLGEQFNPNWSLRRIAEEHEALVRMRNREYSRYSWDGQVKPFPEMLSVEDKEGEYYFLRTVEDFRQEADEMHHCIYSYCQMSLARGEYVAVHLTNGNEKSTLGICVDTSGAKARFIFNQHYGPCDSEVTNNVLLNLQKYLIARLNILNIPTKDWLVYYS